MHYLISIVGPTGVGKTSLSLFLAKKYQTEILSSDSRQMYRYMDIGTAKPNKKVLEAIPHHFIDTLDPDEEYNAGKFEEEAEALLKELFEKHKVILAVGGSTLYIDALWNGIDEMPVIPDGIREGLNQEFRDAGLEPLLAELKRVDPITFGLVDQKNPARVIRALEVYRATEKPISHYRRGKKKEREYTLIKIGLRLDRDILYKRINHRVEQMGRKGLADEVRGLLKQGFDPESNAMQSIGYREMIPYVKGEVNYYGAIKLIQRNSRRYAKRQMNWYRRYPDIKWFEAGANEEVEKWLDEEFRL